jgi:hypothetical protein
MSDIRRFIGSPRTVDELDSLVRGILLDRPLLVRNGPLPNFYVTQLDGKEYLEIVIDDPTPIESEKMRLYRALERIAGGGGDFMGAPFYTLTREEMIAIAESAISEFFMPDIDEPQITPKV